MGKKSCFILHKEKGQVQIILATSGFWFFSTQTSIWTSKVGSLTCV